ncbi:MAG: hypothetical protein AAGB14_12625 [Verrucomicrobiota bacterium]
MKRKTMKKAKQLLLTGAILGSSAGVAMAQGSGNTGADAVITEVNGLVAVAAAVVGAAVLVVVVPWGAKMAVRAFKSIGGA